MKNNSNDSRSDVCAHGCDHLHKNDGAHEAESKKNEIIRLAFSSVFFIAGFIVSKCSALPFAIFFSHILFLLTWFISGAEVLFASIKNIGHGQIFDENFLMTAATVCAFVVGNYFESAAVMLLYNAGELLQEYAVNASQRSIANAVTLNADTARIIENGKEKKVSPSGVAVGSVLLVKPGEKIPIDGIIESGNALVESASLTGESIPKSFAPGDEVFSGFIPLDGALKIRTTKFFSESAASKIGKLIESAQKQKAKSEKFITRFARIYTPAVTFAALCLAVLPPLFISFARQTPITGFAQFSPWLYRSLIFLTVSCPCALVISIPLTYFAGLGGLAKKGILVKGSNFIDSLSKLSVCVFDKTGTLTESTLRVSSIVPNTGFTENEVIRLAAIAEKNSSHPIAKAISAYAQTASENITEMHTSKNFSELSGKGVRLEVDGKELLAGNEKIFGCSRSAVPLTLQKVGGEKTCMYIIYDGQFIGTVFFGDTIREGALTLTRKLKELDVKKTLILTGDNANEAKKIAALLDIDEFHASLLPKEKLRILQDTIEMQRKKNKNACIGFMGDGINDAPALSLADVGIGFAGISSDLALESADVVFLNGNLDMLPVSIRHAKKITRTVKQNITFAIGVKIAFLMLGGLGLVGMLPAVFADVGVCLLTILNSLRARKA